MCVEEAGFSTKEQKSGREYKDTFFRADTVDTRPSRKHQPEYAPAIPAVCGGNIVHVAEGQEEFVQKQNRNDTDT